MRYTILPGTDLKPSVLCMGGGPLCVENEDKVTFELLDTFSGVTQFHN